MRRRDLSVLALLSSAIFFSACSPSAAPQAPVLPAAASQSAQFGRSPRADAHSQYLFVSRGDVFIYRIGTPGLQHRMGAAQGVRCATFFTTNSAGDLFVGQCDNTVKVYAPPYTGAPTATMRVPGHLGFLFLAVDGNDNLFIGDFSVEPGSITAYAPPYTGAPLAKFATDILPNGMAVAKDGSVFVSAFGKEGPVYQYLPPSFTTRKTIRRDLWYPSALKFDPSGNLWIANLHSVSAFAPPYTDRPIVHIVNDPGPLHRYVSAPQSLAFDGNELIVKDYYGAIRAFPSPYTGAATIVNDKGNPIPGISNFYQTLDVDANGDLFAAASPVFEWTGDYRSAPSAIESGAASTNPATAVYVSR